MIKHLLCPLLAVVTVSICVQSTLFVRMDVATVYLTASLPFAFVIRTYQPPWLKFASGCATMIAWTFTLLGVMYDPIVTQRVPLDLTRALISVSATTTVIGLCLPGSVTATMSRSVIRSTIIPLVFGTITIAVLPIVYINARCRHDTIQIEELVEQSRFGEARSRIRDIHRLATPLTAELGDLRQRAEQIKTIVNELESRVTRTSQSVMTTQIRLDHCRQLAMLGRNEQAFVELEPLINTSADPSALDLAGTIHETLREWTKAKERHECAIHAWQSQPASLQRDRGLVRSALRLAHCERKLGNYAVAENYYCEVVSALPTAENHFLLAQFYEDIQQASKAYAHARQAITLDAARYQQSGARLIEKLQTGHFGCLQIYRNGASRSETGSLRLTKDLAGSLLD